MFKDLKIDKASHTYTLNGKVLPSVSSKLGDFYKPFNPVVAKYVARRDGKTEAQVLKEGKKLDFHLFLGQQLVLPD